MRQIGSLPSEVDARRFTAYLVTQNISAVPEQDGEAWAIWVRDENETDRARDELAQFKVDPKDGRYRGAEQQAATLARQEQERRAQVRKNVVVMGGNWSRGGAAKRAPLVFALIGLSVLATIWTEKGTNQNTDVLGFVDQRHVAEQNWDSSAVSLHDALTDIRSGQVWRLFTPIFFHLGILHLVFNMYWLYFFGSQIEDRRGTLRFALLVIVIAAISNVAQAGIETPFFGGMSGVGFGLFGYVWMKTLYDPSAGVFVSRGTTLLFIAWFFLCMTGFVGEIANTGHGVGMAVGVVIGYLPLLVGRRK